MARSNFLLMCLLFATQLSFSQDGRYAIFFNDKVGSSFSVDNPIEYLSQRSIDRRIKNGVLTSLEDIPVNVDYVNQVKGLGADVLHTSRWMNCAILQLEGDELTNIMLLPFVTSFELLGPTTSSSGGRSKRINRKNEVKDVVNLVQNSMLGMDAMHADNLLGDGIVIGVFDSGFSGADVIEPFASLIQDGRVSLTMDIVGKSENVFQYDDHGTEVLSIMAASKEGVYLGGAPNAIYQLYVTEDAGSEYRIEEYNWLIAAEKSDSAGVDIINASLGYTTFDDASMDYTTSQLDGKTAVVSKAASMAIAKGILVVVSAGNDGNTSWKFVDPPADVDGILAVGSITGSGGISNFSSIGPTTDGRIKPDVVALGSSVSVVKPNGSTGFTSGTSAAAPLVTCLAAGLLQDNPGLTVTELYDLITSSGNNFQNPNNQFGHGVPNYLVAKQIVTGAKPSEITLPIQLFPNPITSDQLYIEGLPSGEMATVSVHDLQGKLAMKSAGIVGVDNRFNVDVSQFSPGLYIVKIETEATVKTIRLVKL